MGFCDVTNAEVFAYARLRRTDGRLLRDAALLDRAAFYADLRELKLWMRRTRLDVLMAAQEHACYLCQKPFTADNGPTLDHVRPRSLGGQDARNILLAHKWCNRVKADRGPKASELAYLARVNDAIAGAYSELTKRELFTMAASRLPSGSAWASG